MATEINRRESAALINSLTAGVVPRVGLHHIAVGRKREIEAVLQDLNTVEDGGAAFRFICGEYGSGKSFLLQMIRNHAMERSFVVADADLSPERRMTGTNRQGLATYRELMQHLSIKTRPDGGALEAVLQKWISHLQMLTVEEHHLKSADEQLIEIVSRRISEVLYELSEMTYGFAFAQVIDAYWRGIKTGNDIQKQAALRWLRGEYNTKTEAKKELFVDCIIDDQNWYEFLKLFALFVKRTGYQGLLVFLDEGVNLYKIANKQAREANYEKVLTVFNDTMQGKARYLGMFMSGTPQYIYDERRGLFSYEALRSRLIESSFGDGKYVNFTGPVIRLNQLTKEELYLLLERLNEVHGIHFGYENRLESKQYIAFLHRMFSCMGAEERVTPRDITRDFLCLLSILYQNPDVGFDRLIQEINNNQNHAKTVKNSDDRETDFAEFEI